MDNLREFNSDSFMNYDKKESKIIGEKLFRFVLIPRDIGKDTIPEIGFSYFDEKEQKYLTKWTKPIEIKIIKKKKTEEKNGKKSESNFYFIAIGVVALLFGLGFIFRKKIGIKK